MTITIAYAWADEPSPGLHAEFERAAATWEAILDIDIVEVDGASDWIIHPSDAYGPGVAHIGGPECWIDPSLEDTYGGWAHNTYSALVPGHEIGHLLGLSHPHDYGDPSTMLMSWMSYSYVTGSAGAVLYPDEPGLLDISMLGERYGHNPATAASGTVHRISDAAGINTVWDAGGEHDLLDLSGLVVGCVVDLGDGLVDMGGTGWAVLSGIEDVRLGQGADTVMLDAGMLVYGLSKADTLVALDGEADRLTKGEKRELGVTGRWWGLDGAYVEWRGGEKGLERLVVEG